MTKRISQALRQLRAVTAPLPLVASDACALAGLEPDDPLYRPLSFVFFKVITAVHDEGERLHQAGKELAYHNRAHVADAITALACLLAETSQLSVTDQWLGMIAMAAHDFGHQGQTNQQLGYAQEKITAEWLRGEVQAYLGPEQINRLTTWIIGTDPALVAANHTAYVASPQDPNLLLQVLINEADIAASLLPEFAFALTRQLLLERGLPDQEASAVQTFYAGFRSHVQVSSPAGQQLMMQAAPMGWGLNETGASLFRSDYVVSPKTVGIARSDVMRALFKLSIPEQARLDVEIALGEVLQNIVRHADFSQQPVQKIDIEAIQNRQNLLLQVTDSAKPLSDLGFLEEKHAASEFGGMGLALIHKIATKYLIYPLNEGNFHELYFQSLIQPH